MITHRITVLLRIFINLYCKGWEAFPTEGQVDLLSPHSWNGGNRRRILFTRCLVKCPSHWMMFPYLWVYRWWVVLWRCLRVMNARWMFVSLLSVSPQEADDELGMIQGSSVRLEWLRFKFFMSQILHQINIFSALPELICCIWLAALSSVTRVEREFSSTT